MKPIFIGEFDGRPLRVKHLERKVSPSGVPYFTFLFPLYFQDWDGRNIEFQTIKVQSYGKCDFVEGDTVYLQDCPKGKWLSVCPYRKKDGTFASYFTIFANVSKEKGNRNILKERRDEEDE